jgi:hypothetical protein
MEHYFIQIKLNQVYSKAGYHNFSEILSLLMEKYGQKLILNQKNIELYF